MLNLLIIRRKSLTWFLVILMLEGTLFLILKHWREGLWLLGLWCFPFLRFLSYLFWCFASWGMLNSFIIIQPQHHLGDGQICQSESLENPMKRPYIRWQLVLIRGEERWGSWQWSEFPNKIAVHSNDTHPTLAIPELTWLLMNDEGLGWDEAWDMTSKVWEPAQIGMRRSLIKYL